MARIGDLFGIGGCENPISTIRKSGGIATKAHNYATVLPSERECQRLIGSLRQAARWLGVVEEICHVGVRRSQLVGQAIPVDLAMPRRLSAGLAFVVRHTQQLAILVDLGLNISRASASAADHN